jgi:DNA-binding NtrC family response regulator
MSRILVIDDDPGNRLVIKSRLSDQGYEVFLADTGAGGLVDARNGAIDLFLVAASLGSGIDAPDVCRRLKAIPETCMTPVCIYSQNASTVEELTRAYEAGCEAFIPKGEMPGLDYIVKVQLHGKAVHDDLAEQNRVLDLNNRRLREEGQRDADRETSMATSGERSLILRELAANRPNGVLLVDAEGFVRSADRGACEIFGNNVERRNLGFLAPASGLEAFVRDARFEARDGFRFDLAAIGGRCARSLTASVVPLMGKSSSERSLFKIVLLLDAAKRKIAAEMLHVAEPGIPRQQMGALLDSARETFGLDGLVGQSPCTRRAREAVEAFERHRKPMLLIGERGVGKTRVARTAHYSGPFTGPFLQISCSGQAAASLERELFGYVEGAFPDALNDRPGLFQQASDGTLFLENVDGLSLPMQERLVLAIEQGVVTRVGSERREKVDVGIIATSATSLQAGVKAGTFSRNLLELLSGNMVNLLPLADREEDIIALAGMYVTFFGRRHGVRMIDQDAVDLLLRYPWPGNVTEFESCIREACSQAEAEQINAGHLPVALRDNDEGLPSHEVIPAPRRDRGQGVGGLAPIPSGGSSSMRRRQLWDIGEDDPISLEFYEKKALLRALDHVDGDKLAAARLLKVGKSTLYRKLKRFEID